MNNICKFQKKSSGPPVISTLHVQKSVLGSKEVKIAGGFQKTKK
jgi:hypothetical protein